MGILYLRDAKTGEFVPVTTMVGPKGEPFRYEDFTAEQLEALRGPAGKDAVVDATLTQSGQAAEAKATGEAIGRLEDGKQDKLIQGNGINIAEDGKTISCQRGWETVWEETWNHNNEFHVTAYDEETNTFTVSAEELSAYEIGEKFPCISVIDKENVEFFLWQKSHHIMEKISDTEIRSNVTCTGFDLTAWHFESYEYAITLCLTGLHTKGLRLTMSGKCRSPSNLYDGTAIGYLIRASTEGNKLTGYLHESASSYCTKMIEVFLTKNYTEFATSRFSRYSTSQSTKRHWNRLYDSSVSLCETKSGNKSFVFNNDGSYIENIWFDTDAPWFMYPVNSNWPNGFYNNHNIANGTYLKIERMV